MEQNDLSTLIKKLKISKTKIGLEQPKAEKELVLRDYQIDHVNRLMEIIDINSFYMDFSDTRLGKTICAIHLAIEYNLPVLVICEKTIKSVWSDHFKEYGVPNYGVITYSSLTSRKGAQPKHGLLIRRDYKNGNENIIEFQPTKELLEMIDSGLLLIMDESQAIKNRDSQRYDACGVIVREIIEVGKNSRFGLLSATPFDKEEQIMGFLKLVGLIRSHFLYIDAVNRGGKFELKGIKELIDNCRVINPLGLNKFLERRVMITRSNKNKAKRFCVDLFNEVIKPKFSSVMISEALNRDIKNGFYHINQQTELLIKSEITKLRSLLEDDGKGNLKPKFGSLPLIVKILELVESLKDVIFIAEVEKFLTENPTGKVMISYNYNMLFDKLKSVFNSYGCVHLNGSIASDMKRAQIIETFRNNPNCHVMLAYRTVVSKGISLCPKDQSIPLLMLISPSFFLMETYQVAARFSDPKSKNVPTIRLVYCAAIPEEDDVYRNLTHKGKFLTTFLNQENKIFPNEYGVIDINVE